MAIQHTSTRKIIIALFLVVVFATIVKILIFSQSDHITTAQSFTNSVHPLKPHPSKKASGDENIQVPGDDEDDDDGDGDKNDDDKNDRPIMSDAPQKTMSKAKSPSKKPTPKAPKPSPKVNIKPKPQDKPDVNDTKKKEKEKGKKPEAGSTGVPLHLTTKSNFHVGGLVPIDPAAVADKSKLSKKFNERLALYKAPTSSCVFQCQGRKSVEFDLPDGFTCKEPLICDFTQYAVLLLEYDKLIYQNLTRNGTCVSDTHASCKFPFSHDCFGSSWNEWHVALKYKESPESTPKQIGQSHFYDLAITRQHPFKVISVFDHPDHPELLQVIGYYTPNMDRPDKCNTLYCIYEYPNHDIERFTAIPGDVAMTYCPRPTRDVKKVTLRLTYDHKLMSYPYVIQVTQPDNQLPFAYMTMCVIVRKEGRAIEEWIEFHRVMGYERFVIYDNNLENEPDHLMAETLKNLGEGVIHRPWSYDHSQTEALNECILRYGNRTRWMTFIDADEFLTPAPQYPSIRYVLENIFPNEPLLHSNWLTFGPCGNSTKSSSQVVMEMCSNITISSSSFPKPTFDPSVAAAIQGYGPHFIRLKKDLGPYPKSRSIFVDDYFKIYHYRYRTWPEYSSRRKGTSAVLKEGWDDARLLKEWNIGMEKSLNFPPQNNSILRFIPELKRRLHKI